MDEPVVVHCYTTPGEIEDPENLAEIGTFAGGWGATPSKAKSAS